MSDVKPDEPKLVAFADMPADQKFSYKVTPQPGRLMLADMIGKQLAAVSDLFRAVGKDVTPEVQWICALAGCGMEGDGSVRFDLIIMPKKDNPPSDSQNRTKVAGP